MMKTSRLGLLTGALLCVPAIVIERALILRVECASLFPLWIARLATSRLRWWAAALLFSRPPAHLSIA